MALDDDADGLVGDADGRSGLVDVLAAGSAGAVGVDTDVLLLDLFQGGTDLIGFDNVDGVLDLGAQSFEQFAVFVGIYGEKFLFKIKFKPVTFNSSLT